MRIQNPVCGGLSVALPVLGLVISYIGAYYAERWADLRIPFFSLVIGSLGGVVFSVLAFRRRERWIVAPIVGLLLSIAVAMFFFRLL